MNQYQYPSEALTAYQSFMASALLRGCTPNDADVVARGAVDQFMDYRRDIVRGHNAVKIADAARALGAAMLQAGRPDGILECGLCNLDWSESMRQVDVDHFVSTGETTLVIGLTEQAEALPHNARVLEDLLCAVVNNYKHLEVSDTDPTSGLPRTCYVFTIDKVFGPAAKVVA